MCACRIVGEDDHGVLFTAEQYEEYKKRVIPIVSRPLFMRQNGIVTFVKIRMFDN